LDIEYLAQPDRRIGDVIEDGIARRGTPDEFVLVSAFASLPTVLRMKPKTEAVKAAGGDVRLVFGVDLGGTSKQVLQEVASWGVPVTIVKNRIVGVTFHPKVYLLRWPDQVEIFVGSNNLTEGGFYKNSEATTRTKYNLPADAGALAKGLQELERFLNPSGPTAALLTPSYLASLLALPEIPSEAEARRKRGEAMARKPSQNQPNTVFGSEPVKPAPTLPAELQALLLAAREHQQSEFKRAVARAKRQAAQAAAGQPPVNPTLIPALPSPLAQVDPNYFYMTLPAMRRDSPNIPGEPRHARKRPGRGRARKPTYDQALRSHGRPDRGRRGRADRDLIYDASSAQVDPMIIEDRTRLARRRFLAANFPIKRPKPTVRRDRISLSYSRGGAVWLVGA
jgi:hypothetical protein